MGQTGLRTSLIWHDEVMGDVVQDKPAKVTIGTASEATFTTPQIAGSPEYTIVTPGRRGYLLTLSSQMTGTICIGGVEHEVAEWVAKADEPTGFRATSIGGNDWGVIGLDATGDHKLFFQFVPLEEAEWNLGHPMVLAAVGGFALSVLALSGLWWWKGVPLGEALFRAGSMSSLAIGFAAVVRWAFKQDNESRASLAFSVMLHAALLFATFQLYERSSPFEWPEKPSVSGTYLVEARDMTPPKPEMKQPTVSPGVAVDQKLPARRAWTRPKGKKIEKPSTQIASAVKPTQETGTSQMPSTRNDVPKVGVMVHEDILHGIVTRDTSKAIKQIGELGGTEGGRGGPPAPPGAGGPGGTKGGGFGKDGTAGERKGNDKALDTGGVRAAVCVGAGCGGGGGEIAILPPPLPPTPDKPTLTAADIDRVIKAHAGMFTSCYQKELDKVPTLGGDVTLHFEILPTGRVKDSRQSGGSLTNANVVSCMKRALGILTFPQKGGAIVNYPFAFAAQ
jgi:hypothetical protein